MQFESIGKSWKLMARVFHHLCYLTTSAPTGAAMISASREAGLPSRLKAAPVTRRSAPRPGLG